MEFFQAIDALLDVLDATGTVVGLMALWYTWVVPPRIAPETVMVDVEHFLQAVAVTVPAPSGQPQQEAGGVPKASGWAAGTAVDRG
ncbi:MAG: hypothetical protein ACREGK_08940 [Geminicoccales bacterium]